MTNKKLKTLKDLGNTQPIGGKKNRKWTRNTVSMKILKVKAIKWFLHGIKYRKNPYKMFMEFHNITEEDINDA